MERVEQSGGVRKSIFDVHLRGPAGPADEKQPMQYRYLIVRLMTCEPVTT